MTRMFGLMVNDARQVLPFLNQHAANLRPPRDLTCDGFGIGYYQDDRPLLSKTARKPGDSQTYAEIVDGIQSDVFLVHGRMPTGNVPYSTKNTHPFRYPPWMMAHVGSIKAVADRYKDLAATLPTTLRNNIAGDTDTELIFALFLARLATAAKIDDPDLPPQVAARALKETVLKLAEGQEEPAGVFLTTNGRLMLGIGVGWPLHLLVQNEIPPGAPAPRESMPDRNFRAVLLVSKASDAAGYERIPDRSVVAVHRSLEVMLID